MSIKHKMQVPKSPLIDVKLSCKNRMSILPDYGQYGGTSISCGDAKTKRTIPTPLHDSAANERPNQVYASLPRLQSKETALQDPEWSMTNVAA